MYSESRHIDANTLLDYAEASGVIRQIGGLEHVSFLAEHIVPPSRISEYCKIVHDRSVQRRVQKIGRDISTRAAEAESGAEALDIARGAVLNFEDSKGDGQFLPVSEILPEVFDEYDAAVNGKSPGVLTGFVDIDRATTGFHPGELYFLGARPGMGKTTLAMQWAAEIAKTLPVIYFSIEMPKRQLVSKQVAAEARVKYSDVRRGKLAKGDFSRLSIAASSFYELNLYIDDRPVMNPSRVRARGNAVRAKSGLGAIFVDYLQMMVPNERRPGSGRVQELEDICNELKGIAKTLNVPVIALSQLNRGVEDRKDRRPELRDLRASGGIEQAADGAYFLYREGYYNHGDETGVTEFIIGKGRFSDTGYVNLSFDSEFVRFNDHENVHIVGEPSVC
jgi:replicative DNA helicase